MKTSEALRDAKKLISKPQWWRKGRYADFSRSKHGAFCSAGALARVMGLKHKIVTCEMSPPGRILTHVMDGNIVQFNDKPRRTHKQILARFDRAIKLAKEIEKKEKKEAA